jgi:hypothetical protein
VVPAKATAFLGQAVVGANAFAGAPMGASAKARRRGRRFRGGSTLALALL